MSTVCRLFDTMSTRELDSGVQRYSVKSRSTMLRVSKADEQSRTIITVDGQLTGDSIAVIEACCRQAMSTGKPVHVFLRDVSLVDGAGRALLRRLAADSVRLFANGVYNSYLVRVLNPADTEPPVSYTVTEAPSGQAARRK